MSAVIGAKRERVWRALTVPEEMLGWDPHILGPLGDLKGYPEVGQRIRWRYRLGGVMVILRDAPQEIQPPVRLRSRLSLGLVRLEETFNLGVDPDDAERTRLSLRVASDNSVPVVGGLVDRFSVRRVATDFVDSRLRSIRSWCEEQP